MRDRLCGRGCAVLVEAGRQHQPGVGGEGLAQRFHQILLPDVCFVLRTPWPGALRIAWPRHAKAWAAQQPCGRRFDPLAMSNKWWDTQWLKTTVGHGIYSQHKPELMKEWVKKEDR